MSDLKYDIILDSAKIQKSCRMDLKMGGGSPAQCCATLDMVLFDFEDEILVYIRG